MDPAKQIITTNSAVTVGGNKTAICLENYIFLMADRRTKCWSPMQARVPAVGQANPAAIHGLRCLNSQQIWKLSGILLIELGGSGTPGLIIEKVVDDPEILTAEKVTY